MPKPTNPRPDATWQLRIEAPERVTQDQVMTAGQGWLASWWTNGIQRGKARQARSFRRSASGSPPSAPRNVTILASGSGKAMPASRNAAIREARTADAVFL